MRKQYIDAARGMGIILVVIGHVYKNQVAINWIYSFHMPLFFVLAGLVYKEKPIFTDLKRRFESVLLPYLIFGGLTLIYWQLIERHFRNSDMSFSASLFGLLTGWSDYLDFNQHLWFLPCFFVTVIFYNAIVNIGGRKMAWGISGAFALISILFQMPSLPFCVERVFEYAVFYAVGDIISRRNVIEKIELQINSITIYIVILFIFSFILSTYQLNVNFGWYIASLVGTAFIIVTSVLCEKLRVLQYLGRISLVILCTHGPIYRIPESVKLKRYEP